jgi:hypothetical protein
MPSPGFQVLKLALVYTYSACSPPRCKLPSGARLYGSSHSQAKIGSKRTHSTLPFRASGQRMVNTGEAAEIAPPLLFNSETPRWPSGHKFMGLRDRRAVNWYISDGKCNIQQEKCYKLLVSCQAFSENTILHPNAYFIKRDSTGVYILTFTAAQV